VTTLPRVLVDGYPLGEGSRDRGIGIYLSTVLTGLAAKGEFSLHALAQPGTALPEGVEPIWIKRRLPPRWAPMEHEWLLARCLRHVSADVYWSPGQTPPRRVRMPWLQTLHDLTPLVFPHPYLHADAQRWRRMRERLSQADAILVPSESTASQARQLLGLESSRIHVVPHGVSTSFRPNGPSSPGDVPYVLLVAAWGPHKGFEDAAAAIARVAERGLPHHLFIAGPQDRWMSKHIQDIVAASTRPDRVRSLGFVADLPALYRGADVVVMPSRAEGFGLPVLEAMACGATVVSYDNTSLPEVVGEAGVLVPDGDRELLGRAIADLLEDPDRRAALGQLALARARRFTWATATEGHGRLLRALALGPSATSSATNAQ
jgi:glycosyltransferase involved in cell wall biosynthesis